MDQELDFRAPPRWDLSDLFRDDGPSMALLQNLHDAVYVADENDRIRFWNPAAESVTGFAAQDVVNCGRGSDLFALDQLEPHDIGAPLWFGAMPISGRIVATFAKHRAGHRVPVKINASPIGDGCGGVMGLFVVFWEDSSALEESPVQAYRMTELLQHYVSRDTFEMAQSSARGECSRTCDESEMTVMFVDIVQFTAFAEKVSPGEVRTLLNEFLAICEDTVTRNNGDIDKFIGDCAMAVFHDADDAVRAGKEFFKILQGRNRAARAVGAYELHVRMGIHTGNVARGEIGGTHRKDRTVVGDTVNTAAGLSASATPMPC